MARRASQVPGAARLIQAPGQCSGAGRRRCATAAAGCRGWPRLGSSRGGFRHQSEQTPPPSPTQLPCGSARAAALLLLPTIREYRAHSPPGTSPVRRCRRRPAPGESIFWHDAYQWVKNTKVTIGDCRKVEDFAHKLNDGSVLCEVLKMLLGPSAVSVTLPRAGRSLKPFQAKANINNFLHMCCATFKWSEEDLFDVDEL